MIGDAAPDGAVMDVGAIHAEAAYVDAVEPEERKHRREAPRGMAFHQLEHFVHVERVRELVRRLVPPVPVVKVTGDQGRRGRGHEPLDALAQTLELAAAAARSEREVHADAMQMRVPAGYRDLAVEKPALLETVRRDVLV